MIERTIRLYRRVYATIVAHAMSVAGSRLERGALSYDRNVPMLRFRLSTTVEDHTRRNRLLANDPSVCLYFLFTSIPLNDFTT